MCNGPAYLSYTHRCTPSVIGVLVFTVNEDSFKETNTLNILTLSPSIISTLFPSLHAIIFFAGIQHLPQNSGIQHLLRRTPEKIYKWVPLSQDAELGSLTYPMVLVQIPMFNEREVSYHELNQSQVPPSLSVGCNVETISLSLVLLAAK